MWEHFQEGVQPHAEITPPAPAKDLSQKWFDPQWRAEYLDWYVMITTGEYGLTLFKTQGGFYDPGNTIGNIDPSMAMDPIISQVAAYLPGGAELITELESTTDEERIQEIYGIILTTMADQCLTTPLVYPHQLAVYSDKIANYDFPPDANFTAVQNITLK